MKRLACVALVMGVSGARPVVAQDWVRAEALLARGRVASAEALFFRAATVRPRDPEARMALGRYLGRRGAWRVGAVLLEEARLFGADTASVARELAPLYRQLGDYQALVTLPGAPLSGAQRAQAAWLVSHQPMLEMADSGVAVYRAPRDTGTLGQVTLRIGDRQLVATIETAHHGVVLDTSSRTLAARLFASSGPTSLGTLGEVRIGDVALSNLGVTFEPLANRETAVIGLDALAKLAPTFDTRHGRLVLRRGGRVPPGGGGERLPVLMLPDGVRVLLRGRWYPLAGEVMLRTLRGRTWSLDVRHGELLLEP